jgi:hypothetical protein
LRGRPQSGVAQRPWAPKGRKAVATFVNGEAFVVKPKDQVPLLDRGGVIVDTIFV